MLIFKDMALFKKKLIYSISNRLNHVSIILMYFFNIRFKAKEPIDHSDIIFKESLIKKNIPKIVWMYWDNEEYPSFVKLCMDKIIKNNPDFVINIVNERNLGEFIDINRIPEFNMVQHKADFIRLSLLYKYGGVWIDSSVMLFESLDYYFKILSNYKSNFLSFYWDYNSSDYEYPIVQNWFMISAANTDFIKDWLEEFVFAGSIGVESYIKEKTKNNPEYLQKINDPFYLYNFVCSQKSLRKHNDFVLLNCSNDAILYHMTGSWRDIFFKIKFIHYTNFIKNLCLYKKPNKLPPLIKVTSGERYFIEKRLNLIKYKPNSLLDVFVGD